MCFLFFFETKIMPYCIHLILDFISKTAFLGDTLTSDLHQVFIDYFQCKENYIMRRVSFPLFWGKWTIPK